MKNTLKLIFAIGFLLLVSGSLFAQPIIPDLGQKLILDTANIIDDQREAELNTILIKLFNSNKVTLVIWTLPSLEDYPIENLGIEAAEKWKIGSEKEDQGAILLVALNDRKMRLEVGYGLEGQLTDYFSYSLIESLKPYFKSGNYTDGISVGLVKVTDQLGITPEELSGLSGALPQNENMGMSKIELLILLLFLAMMLYQFYMSQKQSGSSYQWHGPNSSGTYNPNSSYQDRNFPTHRPSGGGGFGGFGRGGGFGGGGASGGW